MKNITDGYIKISEDLTVFPNYSFEQFKQTIFYNNQDGIRIIYLDNQHIIKNRKYIVSLFFRNGIIYMLSLICCDEEFTEINEEKRKILHNNILKEWGLKEQNEYSWGKISSDYDNRSNISSINIIYS